MNLFNTCTQSGADHTKKGKFSYYGIMKMSSPRAFRRSTNIGIPDKIFRRLKENPFKTKNNKFKNKITIYKGM